MQDSIQKYIIKSGTNILKCKIPKQTKQDPKDLFKLEIRLVQKLGCYTNSRTSQKTHTPFKGEIQDQAPCAQ